MKNGETADQSDVRCLRREKRTAGRDREREEMERACRIIEPYMVTVKHEVIREDERESTRVREEWTHNMISSERKEREVCLVWCHAIACLV